jgi:Tfp pilus assembly protein PilV
MSTRRLDTTGLHLRASAPQRSRGVSLVEALVALAVMAFGMLGVVGMQATLRLNGDTSRQNAEAVRIAQEAMENGRAFSTMGSASDVVAYADIADSVATDVADVVSNTTYVLSRTAVESADPRIKTLTVNVEWPDRAGNPQAVRLVSMITGIAPALAAATGVPGDASPISRPRARNRDIPAEAVQIENTGTSRFSPPGGGQVSWVFDNITGVITSVCSAPDSCVGSNAYLLRGYVNFATTETQPTPANAETPPSGAFAVGVQVAQTAPTVGTVTCYTQLTAAHVAYYCAVPVTTGDPRWSGRSALTVLPVATSLTDVNASNYRVCRYTPERNHTPAGGNAAHPLDYAAVGSALTNQNFLVIRAGDGATAFDCPADDTNTPLVNGNTYRHQPAN